MAAVAGLGWCVALHCYRGTRGVLPAPVRMGPWAGAIASPQKRASCHGDAAVRRTQSLLVRI